MAFAAPAMGDAAGKLQLLTGADAVRRADLVIVDRVATLCECTTEAWAERLLYICALGKTVLARRAWRDANAKLKRVNITSFVIN